MRTREAGVFGKLADTLAGDWRLKARPEQLPPPGEWTIWALIAGRGFGKTRTGAEWTRMRKLAGCGRIALVGATASDTRDVMIEGESGLLATSPNHDRPVYEPSKRRLTWANGAMATAYSADEPQRLRGPQHDAAWVDELAAWRYPETWQNLMLGLRLGKRPRCIVTTTPKPVRLIRELIERAAVGTDVVITRGRTIDNAPNLAPAFLSTIMSQYQGTRIGRQELEGELLEDVPGALWQRAWIDRDRMNVAPELTRVVVAVDPPVTSGEKADECGIIIVT